MALACRPAAVGDVARDGHAELDSMKMLWNRYNVEGKYDSLVTVTRPFLEERTQAGDTVSMLYAATAIAQAYMFEGEMDSVGGYMRHLSTTKSSVHIPQLSAAIYLLEGSYAIKAELDYSAALKSYLNGYDCIADDGSIDNRIVFLSNIAHIFYMRRDGNGEKYAGKAWELAQQDNVSTITRCMAAVAMAQMDIVCGEPKSAAAYLDSASDIARENFHLSMFAIIDLLYAEIYDGQGMYEEAERSYRAALKYAEYTDPGTVSYILLHFGQMMEKSGDAGEAASLYRRGLASSYRHKSMEFRDELLARLSSLYYSAGDMDSAVVYYHAREMLADSLPAEMRERRFNELLLSSREAEHRNDIYARDMTIMEGKRRMNIYIFIFVSILVVCIFLLCMVVQKDKADRMLVRQDRNWKRRLDIEKRFRSPEPETNADAVKNRTLYGKVESLMENDRIYRRKDISLDMIAEMTGTNRTYVSKCINDVADMTFYNYIDMYRIREAKDIICRDSMNFKELADFVGYSSLSVFYRVFQRETGMTPGKYRKTVASMNKDDVRNP